MDFSLFRAIQLGVLFAVVYYLSIFDNGDSIRAATKVVSLSVVNQKKELKKITEKEKDLKEFSELFDTLTLQVGGKILSILNSYSEGSDFPVFLSDQAKQLDLYILSLGRVVVSSEEKWEVQEIQLSLEGGYHQLMQFIANIQNQKKLVIIEKITFNLSGSSFAVAEASRLQVNFIVKLYQFKKENKE